MQNFATKSLGHAQEDDTAEGFWSQDVAPQPNSEPWDGQAEFLLALGMLERAAERVRYRGWSNCSCCGAPNGSETFHAKGWQWPSGFAHYVRDHNVKPTPEFIEMVTYFAPVEPLTPS